MYHEIYDMIVILDDNQKSYTTIKRVGPRRRPRRGRQDRGEEEDEKDCGKRGRREGGHGEDDMTVARTASARRIKMRSTPLRTTEAR